MPAVYPGSVRSFSSKIDLTDTVFALHMNDVQDEITAIQIALGTNPAGGAGNVATRIATIEGNRSLTTHTHDTGSWVGLTNAGHDVTARHTFGAAYGTPDAASSQTFGDTATAGTGDNPSREDHKHRMPTVAEAQNALIPVGVIWEYAGTAAPTGWAMCNGGELLGTTYPALAALLGTGTGSRYGSSTTGYVRLPNLVSKFPMGAATAGGAVVSGGTKDAVVVTHNHTQDAHNHTGSSGTTGNHGHGTGDAGNHQHSMYPGWSGDADITIVSVGGPNNYRMGDADDPVQGPFLTFGKTYGPGNHNHGATGSTGDHSHTVSVGSATPTNQSNGVSGTDQNLPPYQTVNYIIKVH